MTRRDNKVEVRREHLATMQSTHGELQPAVRKAREIWSRGRQPQFVRVRRSFVVRDTPAKAVLDERKPLPREERPLSAQMITPKGLTLKLELLLLFAAQCTVAPGRRWPAPYPIEPTSEKPDSWMGLVATIAKHAPPTNYAADASTNKVRQIAQALKALEKMNLVHSATGVPGQVRRGIKLQCENGKSTVAAPVIYRVPTDNEQFLNIPVEFFTQGWVHVLTTSEIAALLMWFDITKAAGRQVKLRGEEEAPSTVGFVNSETRHSFYGLGRETYETHKQLEAFGLMDVHRHEKRYMDGKWEGFATQSEDMVCHRIELLPSGFTREPGPILTKVLEQRQITGSWYRPAGWQRPT
ncbi:hypothetical protein ACFY8C_38560 [Streptomyces flavochromogenes]|uniref:Uncharacterized protein n=1 Tax=Streptomyces flavochromogenes TaxID=68199 RepID=A0ABW6Y3R9_9ACTN